MVLLIPILYVVRLSLAAMALGEEWEGGQNGIGWIGVWCVWTKDEIVQCILLIQVVPGLRCRGMETMTAATATKA